jgi:hypothetical protein
MSRPDMEPTQPPTQQVLNATSPGIKQPWCGVVLTIQLPSSDELSNDWSHASIPPYALKECTGTNLPLHIYSCYGNFILLL